MRANAQLRRACRWVEGTKPGGERMDLDRDASCSAGAQLLEPLIGRGVLADDRAVRGHEDQARGVGQLRLGDPVHEHPEPESVGEDGRDPPTERDLLG